MVFLLSLVFRVVRCLLNPIFSDLLVPFDIVCLSLLLDSPLRCLSVEAHHSVLPRCSSCRPGSRWQPPQLGCIALWYTLPPIALMCTTFFNPLHFLAHCGHCHASQHEGLQHGSLRFKVTKQIDTASTPMERLEVAVHIASEQRGTQQIGDDELRENLNE